MGESSLTGGDLDWIKTGKLTLTGYLRANYAAARYESSHAEIVSAERVASVSLNSPGTRNTVAPKSPARDESVIRYCHGQRLSGATCSAFTPEITESGMITPVRPSIL